MGWHNPCGRAEPVFPRVQTRVHSPCRPGAWGAVVWGCCAAAALLHGHLQASGLSVQGIGEGSRIVIPVGAEGALAEVVAVPTGTGGSAPIEFVLEWQGAVLLRREAAAGTSVSLSALLPGKYFLSAHRVGNPTENGDVSFDVVREVARPSNDAWSNAIPIVRGVVQRGTNVRATRDADEPGHSPRLAGESVWWSWQAPETGWSTVTTRGSGFDTMLGVYFGASLPTLVSHGWNDDVVGSGPFSQVTFQHSGGVTYYFAVDGVTGDLGAVTSGAVELQVIPGTPPKVSLSSPVDGSTWLVTTDASTTNLPLAASITGGVGPLNHQFLLVGGSGVRHTVEGGPLEWTETALGIGEYLWMVTASDAQGLVGSEWAAFSILPREPAIELAEPDPAFPEYFPLLVHGLPGRPLWVETSTNLVSWAPAWSWPEFGGLERVTDTNDPAPAGKFYRARIE